MLALTSPKARRSASPTANWPGGRHPWYGKERWRGHGALTLQHAYAISRLGERWSDEASPAWQPDPEWGVPELEPDWEA